MDCLFSPRAMVSILNLYKQSSGKLGLLEHIRYRSRLWAPYVFKRRWIAAVLRPESQCKEVCFRHDAAATDSHNRQTPANIFGEPAEAFHCTQIAIKGFTASQNHDACRADIWASETWLGHNFFTACRGCYYVQTPSAAFSADPCGLCWASTTVMDLSLHYIEVIHSDLAEQRVFGTVRYICLTKWWILAIIF